MASNPFAFAVIGWLVPGGGYWLLKRQRQFWCYLAIVLSFFAVGVMLKGGILFPEPNDLRDMDNVTTLLMKGSALAKVFAGLPYLAARAVGYDKTFFDGFRFDMGTKLLTLAGLFNLLALADAFSLAFPEKKPAVAPAAAEKKK